MFWSFTQGVKSGDIFPALNINSPQSSTVCWMCTYEFTLRIHVDVAFCFTFLTYIELRVTKSWDYLDLYYSS